jgi:hypothetical protein
MAILSEATNTPSQLASALAAGVESISDNQQVSFTRYSRFVSPLDGFIFWINTSLSVAYSGSLHQTIDQHQEEDETIAVNHIVFTSTAEITQFNLISSDTLFVGTWVSDGVTVQVVFNEATSVYRQAGLWHYVGDAVYPALQAQLVQSDFRYSGCSDCIEQPPHLAVSKFFRAGLSIVSGPVKCRSAIHRAHVDSTEPLGQFMVLTWPSPIGSGMNELSSNQLMQDRVQLTLYGFNNQTAIQYLASLVQYSINTDAFGFCNSPAIKDEKRIQSEISAIAMKKKIDITASYYQSTANALAQRLIVQAALSAVTIT